jgi:hypothetical protein
MICTTPMPAILGLVLERAIQSDEEIRHYVRNIWFAVTKLIVKLSHQGTLRGWIVMLVFSLVLVLGKCSCVATSNTNHK